jgi:hypothetical protein
MAVVATALLCVLLAGCATSRCPPLAPDVSYCLQPPGAGPSVAWLQEVIVTKGERVETLLVQAENAATRLAVVAVSPLGQTLLSTTWDGSTVQVQPALPSATPAAGTMLAFAQFGLLSFDQLLTGFPGSEQRSSEVRDDGAVLLLQDASGRTLIEIRREGRQAPFTRTRLRMPTIDLDIQGRALDSSLSGAGAQ